jgi:glucan phosphoethanolaminetransferase (alkaline phosphatase superfamily)
MLDNLISYIDNQKSDVLVVLHSLGSHGPKYYKRYPQAFEIFTPGTDYQLFVANNHLYLAMKTYKVPNKQ